MQGSILVLNHPKFDKLCLKLYLILVYLGVGTKIDPTLCRADRMVGQVCFLHCQVVV